MQSPALWTQIGALFDEAMALPAPERPVLSKVRVLTRRFAAICTA
jgi:hypothetical protein